MIRDEVVLTLKNKRLAAFAAFIPMVPGDGENRAIESAKRMSEAGIEGFWDGKRELGKAYGKVVRLPSRSSIRQSVAWDVYFLYGPDAVWGVTPPKPDFWMHQLADDSRCLDGAKFRAAVEKALRAID